jgi:hypothetical protein
MGESGLRTLILWPSHLPTPDSDAVAHAARRELKTKIRPIRCVGYVVEARLAVETIEIGALSWLSSMPTPVSSTR